MFPRKAERQNKSQHDSGMRMTAVPFNDDISSPKYETKEIQLIEFFSGVGGMRLAVQKACKEVTDDTRNRLCWQLKSCVSYEIADNANQIYRHNFEKQNTASGADRLVCQEIQRLSNVPPADIWTLSPPCQPFCSKPGAKHLDIDDRRCEGLLAVIRFLEEKQTFERPDWIVLENVKGFTASRMLQTWKDALRRCGYTWKQYLLSPTQFGTPNHRMRYYMICEKSRRFAGKEDCMYTDPPADSGMSEVKPVANYVDETHFLSNHSCTSNATKVQQVSDKDPDSRTSLYVPNWVLEKPWAKELDFVGPNDDITHCFTSSYGRIFHPASGSLFCPTKIVSERTTTNNGMSTDGASLKSVYGDGRARRFTPREVANFLDFPEWFSFPPHMTLERQYKHISNAVNVKVVSSLVRELISTGERPCKERNSRNFRFKKRTDADALAASEASSVLSSLGSRGYRCILGPSKDRDRNVSVGNFVWVSKDKGQFFLRARVINPPPAPEPEIKSHDIRVDSDINSGLSSAKSQSIAVESSPRVWIEYPKGSTYCAKVKNLSRILEHEKGLILVWPETNLYRKGCVTHTLPSGEAFVEIGCDHGPTVDRVAGTLLDQSLVLGIDKDTHSVVSARQRHPRYTFSQWDCLSPDAVIPVELQNIIERSQSFHLAIDIGGNRELPAVLQCMKRLLVDFALQPRLVFVKSRALYHLLQSNNRLP
jgi:tRNA (cytosine38-C5)-methyltransferase